MTISNPAPRIIILCCLHLAAVSTETPAASAAEDARPKRETLLSVGIAQIALMSLSAHVGAYGTVEPAPAVAGEPMASAEVASRVSGVVASLSVFEGQRIKAGDALAKIEAGNSVNSSHESAPFDLTAPLSGVVARIHTHLGATVSPGEALVEILDPARMVVEAHVPADDAPALRLDRPVDIETSVANSKVTGRLIFISPRIDERTGTVAVRASLPPNSGFLAGQFVKLNIATDEHRDIVAVPVESLVKDPDIGFVISLVDGDTETQKPVRVGIRDGDFVEVEGEGVKVGMTVVSSGAYALPRQSKVHVITPTG